MKTILYAILGIAFIILSITGFTSPFTAARSITGFALLAHAALAPVLSIGLALWAMLHASRNRFTEDDWLWLRREDRLEERAVHGLRFGKKVCFWLILAAAVPVILSIALNMFPLFALDYQTCLLRIHLAGVIVLTLGILGYAGCTWAEMNPDTAWK